MRIDLHTHSSMSDGTLRPAALVREAAEVGLDVVALTDHDSVAGWAEASEAAVGVGISLVPGIEISTIFDGPGVHLLGYLFDPTYPPLVAELDRIVAGREGRLDAMVERLQGIGVDIAVEDVRRQAVDAAAIGRPHVADALVAKGIVPDRSTAFREFLSWGRAGHVVRYATPTPLMIRLVVEAGGVAVIGHPWGRGSRHVLDDGVLAELTGAGLSGLEVDHHDHDEHDRVALRQLAARHGLIVTGSSDFHGTGKIDHDLGSELTDPAQFKLLIEAAEHNAASSGRTVPRFAGSSSADRSDAWPDLTPDG